MNVLDSNRKSTAFSVAFCVLVKMLTYFMIFTYLDHSIFMKLPSYRHFIIEIVHGIYDVLQFVALNETDTVFTALVVVS